MLDASIRLFVPDAPAILAKVAAPARTQINSDHRPSIPYHKGLITIPFIQSTATDIGGATRHQQQRPLCRLAPAAAAHPPRHAAEVTSASPRATSSRRMGHARRSGPASGHARCGDRATPAGAPRRGVLHATCDGSTLRCRNLVDPGRRSENGYLGNVHRHVPLEAALRRRELAAGAGGGERQGRRVSGKEQVGRRRGRRAAVAGSRRRRRAKPDLMPHRPTPCFMPAPRTPPQLPAPAPLLLTPAPHPAVASGAEHNHLSRAATALPQTLNMRMPAQPHAPPPTPPPHPV